MEAADSSVILTLIYQTTQGHIPEAINLYSYQRTKLYGVTSQKPLIFTVTNEPNYTVSHPRIH